MGKIVGHCTVGWQVNEAQMAGLTHGGIARGGAATMTMTMGRSRISAAFL